MRGWLVVGMLSVLAAGCSRRDESIGAMAPEARADVRRISHDQNGEIWRGRTVVIHGAIQITVDEEVSFDKHGGLIHGFTRVAERGHTTERWIDRSSGVITVRDGVTKSERPPADRPWIYGPIETSDGTTLSTPLVVWTTYRAATTPTLRQDVLARLDAEVDAEFVCTLRTARIAFRREPSQVDGSFAFRSRT